MPPIKFFCDNPYVALYDGKLVVMRLETDLGCFISVFRVEFL
jgi:hypothetical protein